MTVIDRMHFCSAVGVDVFGQSHYFKTDGSREGKNATGLMMVLQRNREREKGREVDISDMW